MTGIYAETYFCNKSTRSSAFPYQMQPPLWERASRNSRIHCFLCANANCVCSSDSAFIHHLCPFIHIGVDRKFLASWSLRIQTRSRLIVLLYTDSRVYAIYYTHIYLHLWFHISNSRSDYIIRKIRRIVRDMNIHRWPPHWIMWFWIKFRVLDFDKSPYWLWRCNTVKLNGGDIVTNILVTYFWNVANFKRLY